MCNQKPTDDVERSEDDSQEPKRTAPEAAAGQQRTDQRDSADGVRAAHQRRVQRRRHLGDNFDADKNGENKNRQCSDNIHGAEGLEVSEMTNKRMTCAAVSGCGLFLFGH